LRGEIKNKNAKNVRKMKINENTGKKAAAKKPGASNVPLPTQLISTMESCKQYIDNKEEIPDNLMAQLIKGKLLHIKSVEKEKEIARAVILIAELNSVTRTSEV
jgi:hypothetical protein